MERYERNVESPSDKTPPGSVLIPEIASERHIHWVDSICTALFESSQVRKTGIARRSPFYLKDKMLTKQAVIAIDEAREQWAGFCYIESWEHGRYVVNSGLIVLPEYRGQGLAVKIKRMAFELSRERYPDAKLFGLTTSQAVMNINSELGYRPVAFSQLTKDRNFWDGCKSCVNHNILSDKDFAHCLCTGMLFDPAKKKKDP